MDLQTWVTVINFGAWGLAGYAVKYILDDNTKIKTMAAAALESAKKAEAETRIFSERLNFLLEKVNDLRQELKDINGTLKTNNDKLIDELKRELQKHR